MIPAIRVVSSANIVPFVGQIYLKKSLTYITKRTGPKTNPLLMPYWRTSEYPLLRYTVCCRFERYDLNIFRQDPRIPIVFIFSSILWMKNMNSEFMNLILPWIFGYRFLLVLKWKSHEHPEVNLFVVLNYLYSYWLLIILKKLLMTFSVLFHYHERIFYWKYVTISNLYVSILFLSKI